MVDSVAPTELGFKLVEGRPPKEVSREGTVSSEDLSSAALTQVPLKLSDLQ